MNTYQIGDVARLSWNVKLTSTGLDANPGSQTLRVITPNSTTPTSIDSGDIETDSDGDFHYDLPLTAAGIWEWKVVGTDPAPGAGKRSLWVEPDNFG